MKFKSISAAIGAAVLACMAVAGPAAAQDRLCKGQATGEGKNDVTVLFRVNASGVVIKQWAVWTPRMMNRSTSFPPGLMIRFHEPTAFGLGPVYGVQAFGALRGTPRETSVTFRVSWGDDYSWRSPVDNWDADRVSGYRFVHTAFAWSGTMARNPQMISMLPRIGVLSVALMESGRVLASAEYDLSDRSTRDGLFDKAWAAAVKAAAKWENCKVAAPSGDAA